MKRLGIIVAALAAAIAVGPAWAAAPDALDPPAEPAMKSLSATPIEEFKLDTELVVKDWVLCVSQSLAESLVKAREQGVAEAEKAYDQLKAAKSCGQFAEMRVILQKPLYVSTEGDDARVFGALVNIAGGWANAYVVCGAIAAP